jgi:hypothetical protein
MLTDNGITCTGSWCGTNHDFSCGRDINNCYQVEHIIDRNTCDPELEGKDKNIMGNLIMAYGKWNIEVGQLSRDNVQNEKREIYTRFLYETAREFVLTCGGTETDDGGSDSGDDSEYSSSSAYSGIDGSDLLGAIFGGFILIVMIAGIVSVFVYQRSAISIVQAEVETEVN